MTLTVVLTSAAFIQAASAQTGRPPGSAQETGPVEPESPAHWAFVPPRRPEVPRVGAGWVRNPIDAFVLRALQKNELHPSPEADRRSLLRRLSFDLVGLPPSEEEVAGFVADPAADAYEKQVDRLLRSPQYGVRWAQHWLDLARYADSSGFEPDRYRPYAWRYRDWVIYALNRDMPYDTFVRHQLAGDEVQPPDRLAFIATGFLRSGVDMVNLEGFDEALRRQNILNDMTETTGLVFLGLTIGCARCHDHKSDPIQQADFYRLQAFFAACQFVDSRPIAAPGERADYIRRQKVWEARVAEIQSGLIQIETPARLELTRGTPIVPDRVQAVFNKEASKRSPGEVRAIYEAFRRDSRIGETQLLAQLGKDAARARRDLVARLAEAQRTKPLPPPIARGVIEGGTEAPPTHLLRRGDYRSKGVAVSPGLPAVLCSTGSAASPAIPATGKSTGRRLALAGWLTRPDHPLTARVLVNRLWQHHFGRGIVSTPSDFGVAGETPSHPELLDWLATEFVAGGWSLKAMHKLMVCSATYRQSSVIDEGAQEIDPDDALLWRWSPRRLDAESLRDSLLAVSGRLSLKLGGPGIGFGVAATRPGLEEFETGAVGRPEDLERRSRYRVVRRHDGDPFLDLFDRPNTSTSCPRRITSTSPTQALELLNGQLTNDSARALAARVHREAGTDVRELVERSFRLTLGRAPSSEERRLSSDFLRHSPLTDLCLTLLNTNEFAYVE